MKTMTFASAEDGAVESLIENDLIGFQQKYDGTRCVVIIHLTDAIPYVEFLGRGGGPLKHTAAMQWFSEIERFLLEQTKDQPAGQIVLDGEIMIDTGRYLVFDLVHHQIGLQVETSIENTYAERLAHLVLRFGTVFEGLVGIAKTYLTPTEKREFYEHLLESGAEGVMAKRMDAPYEPGKRVRHSLKIKFTKTCDVIATSYDLHRNELGNLAGSIGFALPCRECDRKGRYSMNEGEPFLECRRCRGTGLEPFGSCSAIGKPECVGQVIEVKYLYRQEGGALVQPTMLRIREDKTPEECTWDQFQAYSKAVLS